jgi:hypothetical protein
MVDFKECSADVYVSWRVSQRFDALADVIINLSVLLSNRLYTALS